MRGSKLVKTVKQDFKTQLSYMFYTQNSSKILWHKKDEDLRLLCDHDPHLYPGWGGLGKLSLLLSLLDLYTNGDSFLLTLLFKKIFLQSSNFNAFILNRSIINSPAFEKMTMNKGRLLGFHMPIWKWCQSLLTACTLLQSNSKCASAF